MTDYSEYHEIEAKPEYTFVFDGDNLDRKSGNGDWGPARLAREAKAGAANAAKFLGGHQATFTVYRRVKRVIVTDWVAVENPETLSESTYGEKLTD